MTEKINLHALFIGINDYSEDLIVGGRGVFPPLAGAVPDALEVQKRLRADPDFNLLETVLLNEKATKKAIVAAFETLGKAQKDDLIFIFYSGHGTIEQADKAVWTSETDGFLEGIVCFYDREVASGKIILSDKELRWLLRRLWKKTGAEIVIMFDCCHSGDNTRAVADVAQGTAKFIERKSRDGIAFEQRAWSDFIFSNELKPADFLGKGIDDVLPQGRYIQFSASEDNESALETGGHGVFTTAFLNVFDQTRGHLSYRELHSRIRNQLRFRYAQRPKFYVPTDEANLETLGFLKKTTGATAQNAALTYNERAGFLLNRGAAHGVAKGVSTVQVMLDDGKTLEGRVGMVNLDTAQVSFNETEKAVLQKKEWSATVSGLVSRQLKIRLENKDATDEQAAALLKTLNEPENVAAVALENDSTKADFTVWLWRNMGYVTRPADPFRPLAAWVDLEKPGFERQLAAQLRHMANWTFIARLENSGPTKLPDSVLKIEVFAENEAGIEENLTISPENRLPLAVFETQVADEFGMAKTIFRRKLKVRLTNQTSGDLYVAAVMQTSDFASFPKILFEKVERLGKGESKFLRDHKTGAFFLKQSQTARWFNWPEMPETALFVVSNEEFSDLEPFEMVDLPSPETPEAMRGKSGFDDSGEIEQAMVLPRGWTTRRVHFDVQNPTFNKMPTAEVELFFNEPHFAHFGIGLFSEAEPESGKTFGAPTLQIRNEALEKERDAIWQAKLLVANKWAHFWRQEHSIKMVGRFPKLPRLVSEGDSWFQHPLVEDIIDHVGKVFPVFDLAAAGDTIANFEKNGGFLAEIEEMNPPIFLLSGGGNDIQGERLRDLLSNHFSAEGEPSRYFKPEFEAALDEVMASFRRIFAVLKAQKPSLKIIVHGYDYPHPRPETDSVSQSWLGVYLSEARIFGAENRAAAVHFMIDSFNERLEKLAAEHAGQVFYLNVRGVVGDDEWHDEIHPSDAGFEKIGLRFLEKINELLGLAHR